MIPALVARLTGGELGSEEACPCLEVFWWGWLGNCSSRGQERAVFWTYYACRFVGVVQSAFHALYNMGSFHRAEPKGSGPGRRQELGKDLEDITYPYFISGRPARYGNYPATVSLMYGAYAVLAITSLAAAELSIRGLDLKPTSAIDSIGQIMALVIAGATIIRAAWLAWKLFSDERKEGAQFCGLMWPFEFRNSNFGYNYGRISKTAAYLLPVAVGKSMTRSAESLPLGSVLSDPFAPESRLGVFTPPDELPELQHYEPRVQTALQGRDGVEELTAEEVGTRVFQPSNDYVNAVTRAANVSEYIRSQQDLGGKPKVYLVDGVKSARELYWTRSKKQSAKARVQLASSTAGGLAEVSLEAGMGREIVEHAQLRPHGGDERWLLGYRLTEVTTTRKGKVRMGPFRKGALLL